jgi:predicted ribosome quality control (RQC) complex YloA/Tae2 family protein
LSLNWKEINEILTGLKLEGCHIRKINQPDFNCLVMNLYSPEIRFAFFVGLHQGETRIHSLSREISKPKVLQRFPQFLRSRILGGRIIKAYQVDEERIVRLQIRRTEEITNLWIRLWSGAANIIATDAENVILDAFYRRPKRGEMSGGLFNPENDLTPREKATAKKYEIRNFPGAGTFNEEIEQHYRNNEQGRDLQAARAKALRDIEREEERLNVRLVNLLRDQRAVKSSDQLKTFGDIISSNLHKMKRGESWLHALNYYRDNEEIEIELNPLLSPESNAEAYYNRYKKAKKRGERITNDVKGIEKTLHSLALKKIRIETTETPEDLGGVAKKKLKSGRQNEDAPPGLRYQLGDFTVLVGRTAKENDLLLRHWVRGNDYWLHTRDFPGAYVFIKQIPAKSIPLDILLDAGSLAVLFSKAKEGGEADLYYTQVKYLRRVREGKLGLVIPTQEKNLYIKLEDERIERLRSLQY